MLVTYHGTAQKTVIVTEKSQATTTPLKSEQIPLPKPTIHSNKGVKQAVLDAFPNDPIMWKIASCESRFRQWDDTGKEARRGVINHLDRGVFQVNEYYHLKASKAMGMDILTLEGNIKYARYLYTKNGTRDWNWSKDCWGK